MKKILVLAAALVLAGGVTLADSVTVNDFMKISKVGGTLNGGLFKVSISADPLANPIEIKSVFYSFCLERNETLGQNTWYPIDSIGTDVWMGGNSGGNPDPLDARTAWLYLQFRQGTLTGYTGDDLSIDGLQAAIWFLEGETYGTSDVAILAKADAFIALANAATAQELAFALTKVLAINPYAMVNGQLEHRQSVLTMVPEPGTLLLLGAGLIGMGLLRRRS